MPKLSLWVWLGIGGAVLWLLSRSKSTMGIAGRITAMALDGAVMGIHVAPKAPGATATVAVTWGASTRNFQGNYIFWPYAVQVSLVDPATGASVFDRQSAIINAAPLSNNVSSVSLTVPVNATDGQVFNVRAQLLASTSDPVGNPTGVLAALLGVTLTHTNAIRVSVPTGPAVPGGTLSVVDVAQVIMRQMQKA